MTKKIRIFEKPIVLLIIIGVILGVTMMPFAEAKAACSPHPTKSKIEVKYNEAGDAVEKITVHFAYYDDARYDKSSDYVGKEFANTYNIIFTTDSSKAYPPDTGARYRSQGYHWNFLDAEAIFADSAEKSVYATVTQYDQVSGWTNHSEYGLMEGDFEIADTSVLSKLNVDTTYYALIMSTIGDYIWYTGSYTTINLSKYRHSVTFDYNDHGENFVLPTKNGNTVNDTAVTTNPDYSDSTVFDNTVKEKINNWSTVVTNPKASGYVFKGWYTDSSCTNEATFNEKITGPTTYYAKWIADGTVHYSHGIYNGFAPYWQVGTAPSDGVLSLGNTMTLPATASFTNVGYKLTGWTTTKPTASATTKEYDAGATLTAAQVNALYDKCSNGEITLYAVWERDTENVAWNATTDTKYTDMVTALSSMTANEELFIINDAQHNNGNGVNLAANAVIDGGKYTAKVDESGVQRDSLAGTVGSENSRFTVTRSYSGNCNGHMFGIHENIESTKIVIKNVRFNTTNPNGNHKGFFCSLSNAIVEFDNVRVTDFNGGNSPSGTPMFRSDDLSRGRTTTYVFRDCQIEGNISQKALIVAGQFATSCAECYLEFYGNTTVKGNTNSSGLHNVEVHGPKYIRIGEDFTGEIGVYLPGANANMIATVCDFNNNGVADENEKIKTSALTNGTSGKVFSDQGYILKAVDNTVGVAKAATITFNPNGTTGKLPLTAKVDGVDTAITGGVLDAYYDAKVIIPGSGTLEKPDSLFKGWNTSAAGTGANYTEGAEYTVNSDSFTLYAKWNYIVAELNHDGDRSYYDTLQKAMDAAITGDEVKLLRDSTENVTISSKDITLDLNGYVLNGTGSGSVITVIGSAKLTLEDSNADANHTGNFAGLPVGGTITGGNTNFGGGVLILGGTFTMNAGTITRNKASNSGGGVCVGKSGDQTGVTAPSVFVMNGGAITDNTGTQWGGGVCVGSNTVSNSTFIMNAGIISGNTSADGGGIHIGGMGSVNKFDMRGGTISGNTSSGSGGGVSVYLFNSGTTYDFVMTGGTITGNVASGTGYGVNVRPNNGTGTVTVGGTAQIVENINNSVTQNIYLPSGRNIRIATGDNAPQSGMSVGVTTATAPTESTSVALTGDNGADYSAYFISDKPDYVIKNANNVVTLTVKKTEAAVTAPKEISNLVYSGSAQALVTAGEVIGGVMQYALGSDATTIPTVGWSTDIPTGTAATVYYVWYKVAGDSDHNDVTPQCITATIGKLAVAEPTISGVYTYTGSEQSVTVLGKETYMEETGNVKGTNVGEYTIIYTISDSNHFWASGSDGTVKWVIEKASVTAPTIESKAYTGSLQKAEVPESELYTVTANNGGTAVGSYNVVLKLTDPANYKWSDSEDAEKTLTFIITAEENSWTTEPAIADVSYGTPVNAIYAARFGNDTVTVTYEGVNGTVYASNTVAPTAAGYYKATFEVAATTDYGNLSKNVEFKINKAEATVTITPTAKTLIYNGTEQTLVTEGTSNDGKLQYKLGTDGTYADSVPTALNAGTYTVYYKVIGDNNHNDSVEDSLKVIVSPLDITSASVGAFAAMTYTGNVQTPNATVTLNGLVATGTWNNVTNVTDTTTFTAIGNFTGTISDKATGMLKAAVTAPTIASKVYSGSLQTAEIPTSTLYTTTTNNGGTEVGIYDVVLTLNDAANYKWTDSEAATETVKFEITARPKYAIYGYSDTIGNAVTADSQNAEKDTKITLTIIPANEYSVQTISVTNVSGASITLTPDNTFMMPESEVTVNAVFTKNTYDIANYSDAAGNAVTADLTNAAKGDKVALTVSTAAQYKFKSLTVSDAVGNTVAVAADNTFVMPGSSVTVAAVFEKEEPIIIIVPVQPQEPANTENTEETIGTEDSSDTEKTTENTTEETIGGTTEETEETKESGADVEHEAVGVNPITEKKDALVLDDFISTEKEVATAAIVEAIETAVAEDNTKDFILKADEQTVTEQGIENKAYADAATEEITEITKPAESKTVTLESAVIETLANAEEVESLTVMTSVADVEFDAQTIESINEQSDGSVQLVVTLLKEEIAQTAGENNKVYFDVSLIKEDGTKISTFDGGSIKVTVPIPKACQNEPVVVVYTDSKGHYSPVNGVVNSDGTFTFITEHLSEYILMTKREAEEMYNSIYDFSTLKVHVEESTSDSITIDWNQYEDADGYIIYGNYCDHDGETYKVKKLATITDPSQTEYTIAGLEEGTNYKFRIKAYKLVNGEKYVTVKSHYVHAVTLGGKQRVTTDIKIDQTGMKKTNTVALKEGQSYTINAERLTDSGKAVHHVTMHYESSDASVATVSLRSGKITATGKGTCTVLAIAENGLYEEITVKVK